MRGAEHGMLERMLGHTPGDHRERRDGRGAGPGEEEHRAVDAGQRLLDGDAQDGDDPAVVEVDSVAGGGPGAVRPGRTGRYAGGGSRLAFGLGGDDGGGGDG